LDVLQDKKCLSGFNNLKKKILSEIDKNAVERMKARPIRGQAPKSTLRRAAHYPGGVWRIWMEN